jgi:hypothetical protein
MGFMQANWRGYYGDGKRGRRLPSHRLQVLLACCRDHSHGY